MEDNNKRLKRKKLFRHLAIAFGSIQVLSLILYIILYIVSAFEEIEVGWIMLFALPFQLLFLIFPLVNLILMFGKSGYTFAVVMSAINASPILFLTSVNMMHGKILIIEVIAIMLNLFPYLFHALWKKMELDDKKMQNVN